MTSPEPDASSLPSLAREVSRFVAEREWEKYHSPKNLAMSVAIEAAELMEIFQWLDPGEADRELLDPATRTRVEEESADVLAYLLSLANRTGIDLGRALLKKMEANQLKYPADRFRGKFRDPDTKS